MRNLLNNILLVLLCLIFCEYITIKYFTELTLVYLDIIIFIVWVTRFSFGFTPYKVYTKHRCKLQLNFVKIIQCVSPATETDISLIILNLNRSTFVVWEMKWNVSVVCVWSALNCCDTEQWSASQPASQPACY